MLTDCHENPSLIPSIVGCCMCLVLLPAASTALKLLGLPKHEKELRDQRKDISFREAIPFTSHGRWEKNFPSFAAYRALTPASSREAKCVPQQRWAAACQEPCLPTRNGTRLGWADTAKLGMLRQACGEKLGAQRHRRHPRSLCQATGG